MAKTRWIRYVKSIRIGVGGQREPVFGKVRVCTTFTRQYHDALALTAGLSPCARNLLDYLASVMDAANTVQSNVNKRRAFIWNMKKFGVVYTDGTVKNAYAELSGKGLLTDLGRGVYRVNPMYFMKNAGKGRDDMIKQNFGYDEKQL